MLLYFIYNKYYPRKTCKKVQREIRCKKKWGKEKHKMHI